MRFASIRSQILVPLEAEALVDTPENPNAARPIVIAGVGAKDGIKGIAVTFYGR